MVIGTEDEVRGSGPDEDEDEDGIVLESPLSVQVGDLTVTLELPESAAIRKQVADLTARNWILAQMAALGFCWARPRRPRASFSACRYDLTAYGSAVYDEMIARGYPAIDVDLAMAKAWLLIMQTTITKKEVDAAEASFRG